MSGTDIECGVCSNLVFSAEPLNVFATDSVAKTIYFQTIVTSNVGHAILFTKSGTFTLAVAVTTNGVSQLVAGSPIMVTMNAGVVSAEASTLLNNFGGIITDTLTFSIQGRDKVKPVP